MNAMALACSTLTLALTVTAVTTGINTARAQDPEFLQGEVFDKLSWREVGPTNFSGRVVDIAVDPRNARTFYVATGSGGVFKTESGGARFSPIFQNEKVVSVGDIAVAPSNPDVLYIGTGEANNQRSSYWGNGVYRSNDAGKTWTHLGLEGTDHIGRIVVHPDNPDVVYVAALGALYTPNQERGLYRSTDGGKTWENTKFINEDTGFVDVAMHPDDPKVLLAASYERRRRAWDFSEDGPGSAIWRSDDGGDSWKKMTKGLPAGKIGRIGLDFYARDGNIVYASIENNNPRTSAPRREPRGEGAQPRTARPRQPDAVADPDGLYPLGEPDSESTDMAPGEQQGRARRAGPIGGEVYRSDDGGKTWTKQNDRAVGGSPGYYYGQVRVDPNDGDTVHTLGVTNSTSTDGGKTWPTGRDAPRRLGTGLHVDHHALWIDPKDSDHVLLGNDGGLGVSWDGGDRWDHLFHIPAAQFYAVAVDNRDPYWIYGGTQDNGTWGLPNQTMHSGGISPEHVVKIGGGDGFQVAVDPDDPNVVYYESQFGALRRSNLLTGEGASIRPRSQKGQPSLRFNWMSPILMSPHDPRTIYFGSQFVHRSHNRGTDWDTISPDLSSNDPDRKKGDVPHCTVTCIAESPQREGWLWAGTDDGRVWMSKTGGDRWTEVTDRLQDADKAMPARLWVSDIELSPHDENTAFVSFTGYREDHRGAHVFMTTDGAETFVSISGGLPEAPVNVVRHHPRNEDVVLVGNEFGAYVSVDWGANWFRLGDLPTTPVHDLVVHSREPDIIAATHGRGMFVLDSTVFEELTAAATGKAIHVFQPQHGVRVGSAPNRGYTGARRWAGSNPSSAPVFQYYLRSDVLEPVKLDVQTAAGDSVWSWSSDEDNGSSAGLHTVTLGSRAAGQGRGGAAQRRGGGGAVSPGSYVLVVTLGDNEVARQVVHYRNGRDLADATAAGVGLDVEETREASDGVERDL